PVGRAGRPTASLRSRERGMNRGFPAPMPDRRTYLIDMDGVLVRGRTPVPGAAEFLERLQARGIRYLVLTNNPPYTPRDLAHRLNGIGLPIVDTQIFTSAMATALFLKSQRPSGGTCFVIGESGLTGPLHDAGMVLTGSEPEYVVLGETRSYSFEQITRGIRFLLGGARFVATNPDAAGPSEGGVAPACGALAALMEKASGVSPFFVGKPNPLMLRTALNHIGAHSEDAVMVGDRMDTDIIGGVEAGMETTLVLTGVTRRE